MLAALAFSPQLFLLGIKIIPSLHRFSCFFVPLYHIEDTLIEYQKSERAGSAIHLAAYRGGRFLARKVKRWSTVGQTPATGFGGSVCHKAGFAVKRSRAIAPCRFPGFGLPGFGFSDALAGFWDSLLLDTVLAFEPLNPALRKYRPLFSCVEGVALGTNFHFDLRAGGTGLEGIATGTGHFGGIILGMNILLHNSLSPLSKGSADPRYSSLV
jgi:hypothetical protein